MGMKSCLDPSVRKDSLYKQLFSLSPIQMASEDEQR